MINGLLCKKVGMTRVFTEDGRWLSVTVLEAGPCTVVQRKTTDNDGYDAVQIGFGEVRSTKRRPRKPQMGHFKKAGVEPKRTLREFRVAADSELKPGDEIRADIFAKGDRVDVASTSKGKGFQGVQKRHHFGGGPGTHGSNFHRRPGSIGQCAFPAEVFSGHPMPGHMGDRKVTVQNLEIVTVDPAKNLVLVLGAVPGANGNVVQLKKSVKASAKGDQ
ncbi:MAG: 50S ribosomal protein L3 [Candidatus Hydrogenedentota bacterium]